MRTTLTDASIIPQKILRTLLSFGVIVTITFNPSRSCRCSVKIRRRRVICLIGILPQATALSQKPARVRKRCLHGPEFLIIAIVIVASTGRPALIALATTIIAAAASNDCADGNPIRGLVDSILSNGRLILTIDFHLFLFFVMIVDFATGSVPLIFRHRERRHAIAPLHLRWGRRILLLLLDIIVGIITILLVRVRGSSSVS